MSPKNNRRYGNSHPRTGDESATEEQTVIAEAGKDTAEVAKNPMNSTHSGDDQEEAATENQHATAAHTEDKSEQGAMTEITVSVTCTGLRAIQNNSRLRVHEDP